METNLETALGDEQQTEKATTGHEMEEGREQRDENLVGAREEREIGRGRGKGSNAHPGAPARTALCRFAQLFAPQQGREGDEMVVVLVLVLVVPVVGAQVKESGCGCGFGLCRAGHLEGARHRGSVPENTHKRATADWPCGRKKRGTEQGWGAGREKSKQKRRDVRGDEEKKKDRRDSSCCVLEDAALK
jgi:hypothetical protein